MMLLNLAMAKLGKWSLICLNWIIYPAETSLVLPRKFIQQYQNPWETKPRPRTSMFHVLGVDEPSIFARIPAAK